MRPRISIRGFVHPSVGLSIGWSVGNHFFKTVNLVEKSCVIILGGMGRGGEEVEEEEEEDEDGSGMTIRLLSARFTV